MKLCKELLLLVIVTTLSCKSKNEVASGYDNSLYVYDFTLKQDDFLFGGLYSFSIGEEIVVIISKNPNKVALFNREGDFIKLLEGEFGGSSPQEVKIIGDEIYVWCSDAHEFLVFDKQGRFLLRYKNIPYALNDFIADENNIYIYTSYSVGRPFFAVYSKERQVIDHHLGKASHRQTLIGRNKLLGGITKNDSTILFTTGDQLVINVFKKDDLSFQGHAVIDDEFNMYKASGNSTEQINSDFRKSIEFGLQNAIVRGLYYVKEKYILIAEIGKAHVNSNLEIANENRRLKFYVFNKGFELTNSYSEDWYLEEALFSSDGNYLYKLNIEDGEEEYNYNIYKIKF